MLRDRYSINWVFDEVIQLVPKMVPTLATIDQYLEDGHLVDLPEIWSGLGYLPQELDFPGEMTQLRLLRYFAQLK